MEYHKRIRQARERKGLSQRRLAEMAGISPGSMSAYELGNKTPPVDAAARIAGALGVSLDWLFGAPSGQAAAGQPQTYGELARLVVLLAQSAAWIRPRVYELLWSEDRTLDAEEIEAFEAQERENARKWGPLPRPPIILRYAGLDTRDPVLHDFFNAWLKLLHLKRQGVVDGEVYDAWLEKRLADLSGKPLPPVREPEGARPDPADPNQGPDISGRAVFRQEPAPLPKASTLRGPGYF